MVYCHVLLRVLGFASSFPWPVKNVMPNTQVGYWASYNQNKPVENPWDAHDSYSYSGISKVKERVGNCLRPEGDSSSQGLPYGEKYVDTSSHPDGLTCCNQNACDNLCLATGDHITDPCCHRLAHRL